MNFRDAAYLTGGLIGLPWLLFKAATDWTYRHRLGERFGGATPPPGEGPVLWVHGASVGEINAVRPLLKRLSAAHPELRYHVTALTPAGRRHAEATFGAEGVAYLPLDLSGAVKRRLRRIRPAGVVLVELEAWPNLLEACERAGVPVAIVNGRIGHRSFDRYRRHRWFFGRTFRRIRAAGAQNETYAGRLRELGTEGAVVTGNLKYDAEIPFDPAEAERQVREKLGLGEAPVLVAGSTHDPEERILLDTYERLQATYPRLRFILAPRHIERAGEVQKAVESRGLRCYKWSQSTSDLPGDSVILIDTVGELTRLYSAATAVFIGGTFCSRGGQNMLEPAALGKPVVSGPSLENFRDVARTLVEAGGMKVLDNPIELALVLGELIRDPETARDAGRRAREAVESGRGAVEATAALVETSLLKGA